ncbi:MAG: hypothetical protein U0X20_02455 [Caldilineaceae bacterium]|jgi:hypothetical protein
MNTKLRSMLIGVGAGALLGATFAWVASEATENDDDGNPMQAVAQLGPMDYFTLAIAIFTLARQFGNMLKKA